MKTSIFSKTYAGFSIIYCALMTLIAMMTIVIPIYDYGFTPLNEKGQFLYHSIIAVLTLLVFTPQPIALMSFYFTGGIGKNWFSHISFGVLLLSFSTLVLLIFYVIYLQIAGIPEFYFATIKTQPLEKLTVPIALFGFLHTWLFTIIFTITALIVKKVSLWKRFLPIFSVLSAILLAIIFAILIIAIGNITGSQSIYHGSREATIPHWFMLGSIAWTLIGLTAFWKTNSISTETLFPTNSLKKEIQTPVMSTFNTPINNQKSNKKLYLILGGIVAVILIGVFSIFAVALGLMYLSGPKTTFEGNPNTNSARNRNDNNSNKINSESPKNLKEFIIGIQPKLGNFKLIRVETNDKKKWFPMAKDEALATFSTDENNPNEIILSFSNFNTEADAKKDSEGYKKNIVAGKMKIISEKRLSNGLVLHYVSPNSFGIMDCRDRLCTSITGIQKDKVEKFYTLFSMAQW